MTGTLIRRGLHLDGRKSAKAAIAEAEAAGAKIGAFFCEPVLSCGGQVRLSTLDFHLEVLLCALCLYRVQYIGCSECSLTAFCALKAQLCLQACQFHRGGCIRRASCDPPACMQIVLPEGYMREVYQEMHAHGALCIADEVQCGFGRLGDHFWAFEQQGVVPDIVALGKPIANGFPMGALVGPPPPRLPHASVPSR